MRTRNTIFNLLSDLLPQIIIAIISFFRVKIFLEYLGTEQLGIYQLYGQILSYLSLAELGLTSAVMFYLYKPISEKNYKKISAILSGVKRAFNYVLLAMLVIGLLLTFNIKFFVKDTDLTNTFLMITFILTFLTNVLGYLTTPYAVMFDSGQEKYKYILHIQILLIIRHLLEIILIVLFKNLYLVLIIEVLFAIFQNVIIRYLFKKNYPEVKFTEKKDYCFWKKTKELIPHKIGTLVANNIDVIIVSKVLGLTAVVVYNCYYYITNMLSTMINKIGSASLASVGNLMVSDSKKSYNVFLEYNSMLFFIATIICIPLSVMITPFVKIWYGSDLIVNNFTTILFVFILFYGIIRIVLNTFTGAAGLFKETLVCTITEIVLNITLSLVLINYIGMAGLLLGTSLALIISEYFIKPGILNKHVFKDKIYKYYFDCLKYSLLVVVNYIFIYFIISNINITNLFYWFMIGVIIFIVNFIITFIYYKLINRIEFLSRISFLNKIKFINKFIR
ncbi:MAG: oligosaccharide flippase family protein [Bacilli bacterium]|nr:oligosaccharide flippase family protein [Bacilli bacterium]